MQPKTLLSTQKGFFSDKAAEGQASPDAEAAAAAAGEGAAAAEPDASAEQIEKLENELKSVQKTMEETKKKHLLDLAEMENVRRRTKLDIEENRKYATQGMGKEIVEVCDTLMMAIKNSEKDLASGENPQLQTLYDGLTLIEKNMMHVLSKHHIKKYESLGKAFDPNVHDGIYEIPCAEREVGTVGEVMKEGFTLHDRIIRVAQVGTIKRPPAAQ
jgi:molecular chaperone GrpE